MSKNKFLSELFSFDPSTHYSYNLSETQISNNEQEQKINQKVSKYLQENLTYLTVKYNALINSDIVIRKFTLNGKGKQYNAKTNIYRRNGRLRHGKSLRFKSTYAQESNKHRKINRNTNHK